VTGAFWDSVKMGSELLTSPANYFYPFIAKYDSSGNIKWAKQATGHTKSGALCYAIANDKVSNVFIAGIFGDTITFGSFKLGSIPSYLSGNCFIAKYDSSGNVLWAKNPKLSSNWSGCVGWALATDQSGNVYVGGDFIDTVVFDQDTIIGPPSSEYSVQSSFFLVKYDPNGNVLWAKYAKILDSNDWDLWCLSSDKLNHIYLSVNGGYQQSKIVFGEDTLSLYDTAKYDNASILLKLDSNGKTICGSILPIGADEGNHVGVTSDTTGKFVYFGGIAASVAVFGKDTIDPFDYPLNAIQRLNYFPFVARWEACDSSILTVINRNKSLTEKVILYPNPNNGKFTIALQNVNESMVIVIYNVLGEEICQTKLNLGNTEISLSGQPGGIYFYRVIKETGEFIGNGKIIIEK
jgi:hypothetical protein